MFGVNFTFVKFAGADSITKKCNNYDLWEWFMVGVVNGYTFMLNQ